ncbi:MAG TPA: N,N-dimethylformamidase beta subunit family domain-containing protein [Gemmatimonadales bacterium]
MRMHHGVWLIGALWALGCGGGGASGAPGGGAAQPPSANPSGPLPSDPLAPPVAAENALGGGTGWKVADCAGPGVLDAYASAASVNHGEALDVHVRSNVDTRVSWQAWRMGWYGGSGGRSLARGGPVAAGPQPMPTPDPVTGMVACHWPVTFTVQTGPDWTSGVYLLIVERSDGAQTSLPFVVRADERKGVGVFQASFTTYQAYNRWGGTSLYDGTPPAVEVSFDRPYVERCGSGQFFWYEYDFVRWAESRGFDLTYLTNLDLDRDPTLVQGQRLFLSVGHDEYWSHPARDAIVAALATGTSLAFFSANAIYWQIRLEPSQDGRPGRTQVCWKKRADTEDPLRGTPLETTKWALPPVNEPPHAILGVGYHSWNGPTPAAWIVKNAGAWPYEGTGVKDGDAIPGIVGYETDRVVYDAQTPPGLTILAESPVIGHDGTPDLQQAVVRDVPGGGFVFAAGTIEWSWGLSKPGVADPRVQRITENVLRRAGLAPVQ